MTTSSGSLLVVDDEEMNRDMLCRRLELEGYTVTCAADGSQALELMSIQIFDAVLLDVMMPGLNGCEVLAEIRKTWSLVELPVLIVTAKSHSDDVINAFKVGANDYIVKPINFPVALARINCHVASKNLSMQLRENESRFSRSAQGAIDGLWDWDLLTDRIEFSARWKTMLGHTEDEIGDSVNEWFSRVHPDDLPHLQHKLEAHYTGKVDQFECEHRMRHKDQKYHWTLARGVAICDSSGRLIRMAGSQTDISCAKAADPLTGLPNRVLFMDHLEGAIQSLTDVPENILAVLFVDLDRFKFVNDTLGHHAGDELLMTVARRLESCLRATDVISELRERSTVARFGGDEFVVLLRGLKNRDGASRVAERILSVLAEPVLLDGHSVSVTCSIGVAFCSSNQDSANGLLRDADIAMYRAKSEGKSRSCMFDETLRSHALERLTLEADMKCGIECGEFHLVYQPIVALPSEQIEGFEALLRWQHPTKGPIPPSRFVRIAEETGFIVELGDWVLEQSCRQFREWQSDSLQQIPLFISVNVSARQFAEPDFVNRIIKCLARTELAARCLNLEITESVLMRDPELAAQKLKRLREIGVRVSIDNFGTGYSSLSYLRQFPIDIIKIDRSFIDQIDVSRKASEIVKTIVALARNLGMQVAAKGIERQSQVVKLNEIAFETGQGYLYSRAVSKSSIRELIKEMDQPGLGDRSDHNRLRHDRQPLLAESWS